MARKRSSFTVDLMMESNDLAAQMAEACTHEELIGFVREISDVLADPDFDTRLYELATEFLELNGDEVTA